MAIFSIHPWITIFAVVCILAGLGITWFVFSSFWASATYKPFLRSEPTATRTSERSSRSDGGNASARPSGTRAHDENRDAEEVGS